MSKENIGKATHEQKRTYRTENRMKIANSVAALAKKNADFRKFVVSEASKKFDGDYNVLIKPIMNHPDYSASLKTPELMSGYNAFQNQESESLPEYIIFDGNENTTSYPGYHLSSYDILTPIPDLMIDSAYVENIDVWVIGLNEAPNTANYTLITNNVSTTFPGTCNGSVTTGYFQNMKIKDHKESIFAGRSDVHISRISTWFNATSSNPWTGQEEFWKTFEKGTEREFQTPQGKVKQCPDNGHGTMIRQFSRREVNRQTNVQINWDYFKDWNGQCRSRQQTSYTLNCTSKLNDISGNILYYVIFEQDGWPAPLRAASVPNPAAPGQFINFGYNSEQTAYYWSYFRHSFVNQPRVLNNFRTTNINHPWIEFESRAK